MINIFELTVEELTMLEELQKLRKTAEHLYTTVIKNQSVPLILGDNNEVCIWRDNNATEYLIKTSDGWIWQAKYRNDHHTYTVPINVEKIYALMLTGYKQELNATNNNETNMTNKTIDYFTTYVKRLQAIGVSDVLRFLK